MSKVDLWACARTTLVAAGATLFLTEAASAQPGTEVTDPPALEAEESPDMAAAAAADPTRRRDRVLNLNIDYVDGEIYDPVNDRMDQVRLRSYTGARTAPRRRFVAPAIHARPGDTVRINLNNRLPPTTTPADPGCALDEHGDVNKPHCFNGTNLHTHGLWVNPSGNGDNVLLSINPGVKFEYEYAIPFDHPAGTFWYHTHRHGSTALQVSSGMAGALVIRGDRLPTATRPGDLDTLLTDARDRTIVLQQIQYYCLTKPTDGSTPVVKKYESDNSYRCDPGDVGIIEDYGPLSTGWGRTGRYTSINGLVLPDFRARQGRVERWRLIHGGVRDTIGVQFRKARNATVLQPGQKLPASRMERYIAQNCEGDPLPLHVVAADGLTLAAALRKDVAILQPGYRFDALVVFPESGSYCMIDTASSAPGSVGGVPSGTRLLAMVRVAADPQGAGDDIGRYLTDKLVAAAERTMPAEVRGEVVADLRNGLRLGRFLPHRTVADAEVEGKEKQELTFSGLKVGGKGYAPRSYDPARLDRRLVLDSAQEWDLKGSGHPFHIHVNPFQVVEVLDEDGNDVSARDGPGDPNSQYRGLKGAWKDTLWVQGEHRIRVRTRYQRYIGEFVLHCHILDHEDKGMMQNVAIVLPGGSPASVNAPAEDGHANH
ncbi:MAG TPA: multicopper oxidase family protein [Allosphingosinicella sp.]